MYKNCFALTIWKNTYLITIKLKTRLISIEIYFYKKIIAFKHTSIVLQCVAVFSRCNPEGFDCEYFQTWTLEDICHKVKEENQVWSSWYKAFHPPLVCPIDKVSGVKSLISLLVVKIPMEIFRLNQKTLWMKNVLV